MWRLNNFGNKTAVIEENGTHITYSQTQKASEEIQSQIEPRTLVFSLCNNSKGSLLGYISFLNKRVVPVMLDAALDKDMLFELINNYKPDYLWVPEIIKNEIHGVTEIHSLWNYSLLKTKYDNSYPLNDDLALLLTTSGSTGSPKFVRQSYENIEANTESIVEYLDLDETERPITTMPMSYTYGLSIINSHLWVGASIIMTEKTLVQKEFWQQIKDHKATSFGGVPYIFEMLDRLRFFRMELPALRTMTQAGGKLSPELHKKFAEYAQTNGKEFIVMYGQTEATARMSYLPAEKSLEKYGSMGIAIPGGEFYLIDADENMITESDVAGELVYKGANVTLGYAECGEDLAKGDERNGILITGDMAKRDADGYYYIVGRKKRFLKLFGNRINLDETERLLNSEFSDINCACGGVDDKMVVYMTDSKAASDIIKFLSEKTGINHIAFKTVEVSEIPRNEAGKILYSELSNFDDR